MSTPTRHFVALDTVRHDLKTFYERPVTKVSLELIFSIVAIVFFAVFALRPTLNTMSKLIKEIEDKRVVDDALGKKAAALATAQNEYITYGSRFAIVESAIHETLSLDAALFYLEYLVARENLSLSGLRIKEFPIMVEASTAPDTEANDAGGVGGAGGATAPVTTKKIGTYAIQVTFTGDYDNIMDFFRSVESIRPLFSVQNFVFAVRQDRDTGAQLNVDATIYMYGYQAPTTTSKPTAGHSATTPDQSDDEDQP